MTVLMTVLRLAMRSIAANRVRAALTILGILIGTAAVVVVIELGAGASETVGAKIDSFASNAIYVWPRSGPKLGRRHRSGSLSEDDALAIQRGAASVAGVTTFTSTRAQVIAGDSNAETQIVGTTLPYFWIRNFDIQTGDKWSELDERSGAKVCVIGQTVREALFGAEDPIGRTIRIAGAPYRVIGLTKSRGSIGENQDDRILMPIASYRARIVKTSRRDVHLVIASAKSAESSERTRREIEGILREKHRIKAGTDDDFRVTSQAQFREMQQSVLSTLSWLLLGVAAVSLIVGGVGVMNIMLVGVTERTREIGIRLSIGARERDILVQFLIEAVVLTMLGGGFGLLLGSGLIVAFGRALDWPMRIHPESVVLSIGTAALTGLVFGILPARRAARLNPIDALRTE